MKPSLFYFFFLTVSPKHFKFSLLSVVGHYLHRKQMFLMPFSSRKRQMDGESEEGCTTKQGEYAKTHSGCEVFSGNMFIHKCLNSKPHFETVMRTEPYRVYTVLQLTQQESDVCTSGLMKKAYRQHVKSFLCISTIWDPDKQL